VSDVLAAVIARLQGDTSAPLNVYDSRPSSPTYPYVVVYAGAGIRSSDREADERIRHEQPWQTTTVGVSASQCRAALARVADRLENWTPAPSGWTCSKVEHTDSQPITPDESLPDRVVFYAIDQWSTVADPA
jgi:hypothetical protein